jgi:hypothetical protein
MPDLRFQIESVTGSRDAVSELIAQLRISNDPHSQLIESISLRCQILIEPARRRYSQAEKPVLSELFGPPEHWGSSFRTLPWAATQTLVPTFSTAILVNLPIPCDVSPSVHRYLAALQEGDIPIVFLFSGTVFYHADDRVQVAPIPWDREARFHLQCSAWRKLMGEPNVLNESAALEARAVFDFVERLKAQQMVHRHD